MSRLLPERSPPRLLSEAASGSLKPPPTRRLRTIYLHLSHSIAPSRRVIPIDLTVDTRGVPNGKVVHPTSQVPVQLSNQDRDWFEALMTVRHFVQLLPLLLDCLRRRKHIQVLLIASFQIAVVPKRVHLVGGLATFVFLTRPNRVHLRCGSRVRPCQGFARWIAPSHACRATCPNRQFTW